MVLLVGDGEGYLSVLPARTDSKFFAIDLWEPSLRHQVTHLAAAFTLRAAQALRAVFALQPRCTLCAPCNIWLKGQPAAQ